MLVPFKAQEVEETMKRIQSHKGVVGTIVVNAEGYVKKMIARVLTRIERFS